MHPFETKLFHAWPPCGWQDVSVVVAVSGGADSVALLRALSALKTTGEGQLRVAHFNHRWRGDESNQDADFVADVSEKLSLSFHLGTAPDLEDSTASGEGWEAFARQQRYEFLRQTAERVGARYIVTAHTASDQAETVLQRILRGTGLRGLAGIPRHRLLSPAVTVTRPMLGFFRSEITEYLKDIGQDFRTDSSNLSSQYTRNRLRHELLPLLRSQYNPDIDDALLRLAALADETQSVLKTHVDALMTVAQVRSVSNRIEFQSEQLGSHPGWLLREMLVTLWNEQGWPAQEMNHARWIELEKFVLVDRESSAMAPRQLNLPGNVFLSRDGQRIILRRDVRHESNP